MDSAVPVRAARLSAWRSWRYPVQALGRDLRIDFLRGLAMLFVVVDHITLRSGYHLISHERIGVISGAELFVVLSGVVLGITQQRRAATDGWRAAADRAWSRALLLYIVCLAVMIGAYVLSHAPYVDPDELTTWTDESTGAVYSMYGSTPLLADYPVAAGAVMDVVLLDIGPYQFSVVGLYVVLLAIAPLIMRLILAGRSWAVLGVSVGLYAVNTLVWARTLPSQFEYQFPLLSWQLLFVTGLLAGVHWDAIKAWFSRPIGRAFFLVVVAAAIGFALFASSNPGREFDPGSLRLHLVGDETYWRIYDDFFRRDFIGILRVVNVFAFLIVAYALLTRFWKPLNRLLGWLLVPLGGATLYVFILHLVFALLVASLPFLDEGSVLEYTIVHTVILLALWLMVKREFLFRWVPR
jgi:hypothetical protein